MLLLLGESGSGKSLFIWELIQEKLSPLRKAVLSNQEQGWPALFKTYQEWFKKERIAHQEWLPLYIELKDYTFSDLKGLLDKHLAKETGMLGTQLEEFRRSVGRSAPRILLILDGFDELMGAKEAIQDLFSHCLNGLWTEQQIKLVVTCRTRYFETRAEEDFAFRRIGRQDYMRRILLPFSESQIDRYIASYIEKRPIDAQEKFQPLVDAESYKKVLKENASLKDVVRNPLLLSMFIETFPALQRMMEPSAINRFHIYEAFMEQWFNREITRFSPEEQLKLRGVSSTRNRRLIDHFNNIAERLAMTMFNRNMLSIRFDKSEEASECDLYMLPSENKLTPEMEEEVKATKKIGVQRASKGKYGLFFLSKRKQKIERQFIDEKYISLIKVLDQESFTGKQYRPKKGDKLKKLIQDLVSAYGGYIQDKMYDAWDAVSKEMLSESEEALEIQKCLIHFKSFSPMRQINGQHNFMHRSFYEYYVAACLLKLAKENAIFEGVENQTLALLNHRKIQKEPEAILFLATLNRSFLKTDQERFRKLEELLFAVVEHSKDLKDEASHSAALATKHRNIFKASANAATLLNWCDVSLAEKQWQNVQLPGADLSHSLLYGSDLKRANLRGINLVNALLGPVDLRDADLRGVKLGVKPSIILFEESSLARQYNNQPNNLAVARVVYPIPVFHPDCSGLVVAKENNVILIDDKTGQRLAVLAETKGCIKAISFNSNGQLFASGGWDSDLNEPELLLWKRSDADRYKYNKTPLRGSQYSITHIELSKNCIFLLVGGEDCDNPDQGELWLWEKSDQAPYEYKNIYIAGSKWYSLCPMSELNEDEIPKAKKIYASVKKEFIVYEVMSLSGQRVKEKILKNEWESISSSLFPTSFAALKSSFANLLKITSKKEHTRPIFSIAGLALSEDGGLLASSGENIEGDLWLWKRSIEDSYDYNGIRLKGLEYPIASVAFSRDAHLLASGGGDDDAGELRLWKNLDHEPLGKVLSGHKKKINCVTFSSDSRLLISGSDDYTCRIWYLMDQFSYNHSLIHHTAGIRGIALREDAQLIAYFDTSYEPICHFWEVSHHSGKPVNRGHTAPVYNLAFSPDGSLLASAARDDNTCYLWNTSNQRLYRQLPPENTKGVMGIAFQNHSTFISVGSERICQFWQMPDVRLQNHTVDIGHGIFLKKIVLDPKKKLLTAVGCNSQISLWKLVDDKPYQEFSGSFPNGRIQDMAFSPDGELLALVVKPSDNSLASLLLKIAVNDCFCYLMRLSDHKIIKRFNVNVEGHVGFSPDGKLLALVDVFSVPSSGKYVWRCFLFEMASQRGYGAFTPIEEGFDITSIQNGTINNIAFSPDSALLASVGMDRICRLWEVSSRRCVKVIRWPVSLVSVAFNPKHKEGIYSLAMGDWRGNISFWNVSSAKVATQLEYTARLTGVPSCERMPLWLEGARFKGCKMTAEVQTIVKQEDGEVSEVIVEEAGEAKESSAKSATPVFPVFASSSNESSDAKLALELQEKECSRLPRNARPSSSRFSSSNNSESEKSLVNRNHNQELYNNNSFFSPSRFATRYFPFGPYRDYLCVPDDPRVQRGLELSYPRNNTTYG